MGMYTQIDNWDAKIKTSIEELESEDFGFWIAPIGNGELNFWEWSDTKLYGYFSEDRLKEFRRFAKHIEGWIEGTYEEGDKFRIIFKDGETFIQTAIVDWSIIPMEKL